MSACHHQHTHNHQPVGGYNHVFMIAVIANGAFVILQIIYSYLAHSTGLLADAIHNLGDVLGLILAWIGNSLLKTRPTAKTSYGMKKISILAALANGILLVFSCGMIVTEALYNLITPKAIDAVAVMIVAGIGIFVNGGTAVLFLCGKNDLNLRAAYLHLVSDALISVGVVIAAAVVFYTGWLRIDPIIGLIIAIVILKGTWSLFVDSFCLLIDSVPKSISLAAVQDLLLQEPGVTQVHDLHIWALSTQENALSVHLLMPKIVFTDLARQQLIEKLKNKYNISHVTIQIENDMAFCNDACMIS